MGKVVSGLFMEYFAKKRLFNRRPPILCWSRLSCTKPCRGCHHTIASPRSRRRVPTTSSIAAGEILQKLFHALAHSLFASITMKNKCFYSTIYGRKNIIIKVSSVIYACCALPLPPPFCRDDKSMAVDIPLLPSVNMSLLL